ncbi:MAG TPA: glycoside hydrolase family 20 zincin-like fold domain-containing protein, partial [Flavisolibacter sp.]|nr:glycoside hydrolase family 20 zincin-like fold domain-containing protein [Flavisolibacter sp.]
MSKKKYTVLILFFLFQLVTSKIVMSQTSNALPDWRGPQTLEQLAAAPVALIPFPQQAQWRKEHFKLNQNTVIAYAAKDLQIVNYALRSLTELLRSKGLPAKLVKIKPGNQFLKNSIELRVDKNLPVKEEGYTIDITGRNVVITG